MHPTPALVRCRAVATGLAAFLVVASVHAQLLSEDFSVGAANFTVVSGGTWSVTGGQYVLTNPAAGTGGQGNANIAVHNTNVTTDFTLTVDASTTATTSAWNDFSVLFNYQNASNYYYVSFNESNDGLTSGIFKMSGGVQTQLADITTLIAGGTTYAVKIVRAGNTYSAYLNNTLVASATDTTFTSGKVGFGTLNDGATYDNLVVTVPGTNITAATGFYNSPIASQNGTLTAEFDVVPSLSAMDALVSLSQGDVTAYAGMATIIRFNNTGTIDARNGGAYSAASSISYTAGTSYHVRMAINVMTHTYSIYVRAGGGAEQTVGIDYAFRTEQAGVTALDRRNAHVNTTPGGTIAVNNFTLTASAPLVATPTFSVAGGTYSTAQSVTISTATSGASIRYTTDGSAPTSTHGTLYSSPVWINAPLTLKAIAYKSGWTDSSITSAAYAFTVPVDYVACYLFTGNANDSGQSALHATVNGGAALTTDRFGRASNAYVFDGVNDYLEIADNNAFSVATTGKFSISVWMRPDVLDFIKYEGTHYVHWFGKGVTGQHEWTFRIYNLNGTTENPPRPNRTSFYVYNLSGGLGAGSFVQETLTAGQWIHFVATVDVAADNITWYKNGAPRDSDTLSGYSITPANGTAPVRIGTRDFASYFQGAVDDIRVYNRVLSLTEVQTLFNEPAP